MKGVREAELAAHGEVWIASADVSGGDLKLEFTGPGEAAPGTDVALIRDGYVAVTPLGEHRPHEHSDARGAADAIEAERAGRESCLNSWRPGRNVQTNAPCALSTRAAPAVRYSSERHDVTRPLRFPSPEW